MARFTSLEGGNDARHKREHEAILATINEMGEGTVIRIRNIICFSAALFMLMTLGTAADIHEAAKKGDLGSVKTLLGDDPEWMDARDVLGKTPLHWASMGVHRDLVVYLVKKGADVNAGDTNKITPLHSLALRGNVECINLLMKRGVDIAAKDLGGTSALMYAANGGHGEVVALLLAKGMDPNDKDNAGRTPLHYAAFSGRTAVVEELIRNGAAIDAKNNEGLTATDLARDEGHEGLAQLLISKGGRSTPVRDPQVARLSENTVGITFPYAQRSNTIVLLGSEGVLLIDTGYGRTSKRMMSTVNELSDRGVKYILNTHQHRDHTGGNALVGEEVTIIDGANLDEMVSRGILKKGKGRIEGKGGRIFEDYYTMRFNDERIRLIPFPGIHSDADVIIYLMGSGIVHMGDLLISESFPSVGPRVGKYLDLLERVIDVFAEDTRFISGHGRDLNMTELVDYQKMLLATSGIVRKGMECGKGVAEMQEERLLGEYESYNTFIRALDTDYWIGAVYECYKDTLGTED